MANNERHMSDTITIVKHLTKSRSPFDSSLRRWPVHKSVWAVFSETAKLFPTTQCVDNRKVLMLLVLLKLSIWAANYARSLSCVARFICLNITKKKKQNDLCIYWYKRIWRRGKSFLLSGSSVLPITFETSAKEIDEHNKIHGYWSHTWWARSASARLSSASRSCKCNESSMVPVAPSPS